MSFCPALSSPFDAEGTRHSLSQYAEKGMGSPGRVPVSPLLWTVVRVSQPPPYYSVPKALEETDSGPWDSQVTYDYIQAPKKDHSRSPWLPLLESCWLILHLPGCPFCPFHLRPLYTQVLQNFPPQQASKKCRSHLCLNLFRPNPEPTQKWGDSHRSHTPPHDCFFLATKNPFE